MHLLPVPLALLARERVWHTRVLGVPRNSIVADVAHMVVGAEGSFARISDVTFSGSAISTRSSAVDRRLVGWDIVVHSHEVSLARYSDAPPANSVIVYAQLRALHFVDALSFAGLRIKARASSSSWRRLCRNADRLRRCACCYVGFVAWAWT